MGLLVHNSSILKGLDGKTRQRLTEMFSDTPYRLCCTATPAPNDIAEIANHAEFLGIMSRVEMLAAFFVHDDDGWRLKGHAEQPFYRWLASWGMSVRKPSDIGPYSDDGYILPKLTITPLWVAGDFAPDDQLFFTGLKGISDRIGVRKQSLAGRVEAAAQLVNASSEQWIVWCGLNDESTAIARMIPGAVDVAGSDTIEHKTSTIEAFQDGRVRVMVTKSKVAGFGMNFQGCHNMAFVGLSDSWESYYQCIRRCYRFGQQNPVNAYIVLSEAEEEIYRNVMDKEKEATTMSAKLIEHVQQFERQEIEAGRADFDYRTDTAYGENWQLMLGDSVERLAELANDSVDLSVFSPPFMSLYTYSPTERDLGNSKDADEFFEHFAFVIDELLRVTKPGRNCCVHTADVPAMLGRDGYIGLKDFPGMVIAAFTSRGWVWHDRITIDKNPQPQALRTKAQGLLFSQLEKDSARTRTALGDYILVFKRPGKNAVPIIPDVTRQQWILWARAVWYAADYAPGSFVDSGGNSKSGNGSEELGIRETDTLQYTTARTDKDERHICPLQLGTIERCIRLWSNKGETVLDPFNGIGSTGHVALTFGRKYQGIELKPAYWNVARRNLEAAETALHMPSLLDLLPAEA